MGLIVLFHSTGFWGNLATVVPIALILVLVTKVLIVGVRAVQLLTQLIKEIRTNQRGNISTKMKNDIKEVFFKSRTYVNVPLKQSCWKQ